MAEEVPFSEMLTYLSDRHRRCGRYVYTHSMGPGAHYYHFEFWTATADMVREQYALAKINEEVQKRQGIQRHNWDSS